MNNELELKPCPVCGGRAEIKLDTSGHGGHIECMLCHSHTEFSLELGDLVNTWNNGNRESYKLKSLRFCPVCGSSAGYYKCKDGHRIECINYDYCGFMTPIFPSYEEAADFWNGDLKFENLLKPCPICGGAVKLHNSDDSYKMRVECTQCHCHLDAWSANDKQVGERWNDYELPVKRAPAVKSCPICGTAAQHGYIDGKHYVSCDNTACWFQTPLVDTQQEAADIWNGEVKNG